MNLHLIPLKLVIASILIFSIFLPFSSCTKYTDTNGNVVKTYDLTEDQIKEMNLIPVKKNTYLLKEFSVSQPHDWLLVFCFIWALPVIAATAVIRKNVIKTVLRICEPLIAVFACYIIWGNSIFGPEAGSFLAFCANFTLMFIAFLEFSIGLLARYQKHMLKE